MIEILILSLIQGITEFLPISSSSHLILVSEYLNFKEQGLSVDVSLHIGSFIAVLTYFHKEILEFINNRKLFLKIFISSIPVMLVGFILVETNLINKIRNLQVISWTTIIFGVLLYISDKCSLEKKIDKSFTYKSAIFIGLFQVLSLIPGVSRSGIAITAARILKFKRYDAAKVSFLLSIPILGAVSLYGFKNLFIETNLNFTYFNLISAFLSFVFSYITIKYFLIFIKKFSLNIFIIYRILLGVILLFIDNL
mgnify:FL=1